MQATLERPRIHRSAGPAGQTQAKIVSSETDCADEPPNASKSHAASCRDTLRSRARDIVDRRTIGAGSSPPSRHLRLRALHGGMDYCTVWIRLRKQSLLPEGRNHHDNLQLKNAGFLTTLHTLAMRDSPPKRTSKYRAEGARQTTTRDMARGRGGSLTRMFRVLTRSQLQPKVTSAHALSRSSPPAARPAPVARRSAPLVRASARASASPHARGASAAA